MPDLNRHRPVPPSPGASGSGMPSSPDDVISCRATNPVSIHDDLAKVFLDKRQARATTATRLFRNGDLFSALRRRVLPDYFRRTRPNGRPFTVWSGGCSSGEEVYSLAMVAFDEFAQRRLPPRLEAYGTDINPDRLAEARAGRYGVPMERVLDKAQWDLLRRHARVERGGLTMNDDVRACCRFGIFDMRNRPKTHTFDFIVCNHVLQYYDTHGQLHILRNLIAVANAGGYLYLEGITENAVQPLRLRRVEDQPCLFHAVDAGADGRHP